MFCCRLFRIFLYSPTIVAFSTRCDANGKQNVDTRVVTKAQSSAPYDYSFSLLLSLPPLIVFVIHYSFVLSSSKSTSTIKLNLIFEIQIPIGIVLTFVILDPKSSTQQVSKFLFLCFSNRRILSFRSSQSAQSSLRSEFRAEIEIFSCAAAVFLLILFI